MNICGSMNLSLTSNLFEVLPPPQFWLSPIIHHVETSVLCLCRGSFEISRSGQTFELWDGIQAHLSTCASPKVVEAVNKFKNKIALYEVSRASTWPVQFQENGVREDNIALFFFAKDLQR